MYFRFDVLVALGLILMQAKIVAKKLVAVELKSVVAQLKAVGSTFLRIKVLKKWPMTLPHLVGKALLRKLDTFLSRYRDAIFRQYDRSISWYNAMVWHVKIVVALIVVFAALGLSVSSVGLWVILLSVKLPLWIVPAFSSGVQMTWATIRKVAL